MLHKEIMFSASKLTPEQIASASQSSTHTGDAAVHLDQRLRQRQADALPARARALGLQLAEHLEDAFVVLGRDAGAAVGHLDHGVSVVARQPDAVLRGQFGAAWARQLGAVGLDVGLDLRLRRTMDAKTEDGTPVLTGTASVGDVPEAQHEIPQRIAKLRPATTSGNPVLLKINMDAGHGGASGRFDFLKEIALDYAFAVWAVERDWEHRA